jgi:fructose-1,6-bisphosphatase
LGDDEKSILEINLSSLHERNPVILGSSDDIAYCEEFLKGEG